MIANRTPDGWEVIYQPAHALLSARLAGRWRWAARPARWWQTLVAVAQHDNGWREWEERPTRTEAGEPRNFTQMSPQDALAQWRRGVASGLHQGRWVGLLVSRHATSLYDSRRGELADLDAFLDEQAAQQAAWIEALGTSEAEVERAYAMVRWTDWLSLILCWRRLPADGSALSVGEGPDGVQYEARQREDGAVAVAPWPFDEPRFRVTVEARRLARPTFESDAALREALAAAPVVERSWELTA